MSLVALLNKILNASCTKKKRKNIFSAHSCFSSCFLEHVSVCCSIIGFDKLGRKDGLIDLIT